jgi:hypothetical protein
MDEADGMASYAIDLPDGGDGFIIGNSIQQGPEADNSHIISYGGEGLAYRHNTLYVVNNTIVNERHYGIFIRIAKGTGSARVINNIFYGNGDPVIGRAEMQSNLSIGRKRFKFLPGEKPGFKDEKNYDYRLTAKSPAIDKGTAPGSAGGFDLTPVFHYVHPLKQGNRKGSGSIDIGAYEFDE